MNFFSSVILGGERIYCRDINSIRSFDTVADMLASDAGAGVLCSTCGYYSVGDGGSAVYLCSDAAEPGAFTLHNEGGPYFNLIVSDAVSIKATGAKGDGLTDDAGAINSAISAAIAAGATRIVIPRSTYYLASTPEFPSGATNYTDNILLDMEPGCIFTGPGVDLGEAGAGKFDSTVTNPGLVVSGPKRTVSLMGVPSAKNPANGITADASELVPDPSYNFPIQGLLTISVGSSQGTIQLVTSDTIPADSMIGAAVVTTAAVGDWPADYSKIQAGTYDYTTAPRIKTISASGGNTYTVTLGTSGAEGLPVSGAFSSPSNLNAVSVYIMPHVWMVLRYDGIKTGADLNPEMRWYGKNTVLEINGQPVIGHEIDMIHNGSPVDFSRGVFITGSGSGASKMVGLDVQMGGNKNIDFGVSVRNAEFGAFSSARRPFVGSAAFNDQTNGGTATPPSGVYTTDNLSDSIAISHAPLFGGKMVSDSASGVVLVRHGDSGQSGFFLVCYNAAENAQVLSISADGTVNLPDNDILIGANTHLTCYNTQGGQVYNTLLGYIPITAADGQAAYIPIYR